MYKIGAMNTVIQNGLDSSADLAAFAKSFCSGLKEQATYFVPTPIREQEQESETLS